MARIILVRHGQASFGAADYDCLSSTGEEQARHLGRVLKARGETVDTLWTGGMRRHRQTAEGLLEGLGAVAGREPLPGFNEFDHQQVIARHEPRYADHGAMSADLASAANPRETFAAMFRAAMARWTAGAHHDYDESWAQFQGRCVQALEQVASEARGEQPHLVVTSGGVISVIAQALLGLSDEKALRVNWTLANASVSCVQTTSRGERMLLSLNEHGHFRGDTQHLLTWR
ncbi:histidine phosphatase family protein [Pseudomonas sp. UL073]|uniref:Histidine phosphatase family protein n=1 Tax=Zestomonas insulae TaxID=2809017 RepID=A0ABS2IF07_9GAMM|nr:histidine phosphatase family protein [Pseudomonas insulae]MBM7060713.1 histidine phosphatase family protein [Pseudomonas insulae]